MKRAKTRRAAGVLAAAGLLLASCGSGSLTLTEYVEELDALFDRAVTRYESLVTTPGANTDVAIVTSIDGGRTFTHARILSIDTSRAESLPGVHGVITSQDLPEVLPEE